MAGRVTVVAGGQYGSEAKGHVAAQIVKAERVNYAVRVGGPNAGHTVVDKAGNSFALRTIPVAAAINDSTKLVIAAGSEIDVEVLFSEIKMLEDAGHPVADRLYIDASATIITDEHKQNEIGMTNRIGSTAKGIGAARAARLMRTAPIAEDINSLSPFLMDTGTMLAKNHALNANILIEGTQGYQLGVHSSHYPYSTSGDCRAIDFLTQAHFTPHVLPYIWLVFRTFPIRVAGNSGKLQRETTWEELNQATNGYITAERTTVTKKVRRVARWSSFDALTAINANGSSQYPHLKLALMFVDYLAPEICGVEDFEALKSSVAWKQISAWETEIGMPFSMFGTSKSTIIMRGE